MDSNNDMDKPIVICKLQRINEARNAAFLIRHSLYAIYEAFRSLGTSNATFGLPTGDLNARLPVTSPLTTKNIVPWAFRSGKRERVQSGNLGFESPRVKILYFSMHSETAGPVVWSPFTGLMSESRRASAVFKSENLVLCRGTKSPNGVRPLIDRATAIEVEAAVFKRNAALVDVAIGSVNLVKQEAFYRLRHARSKQVLA
jgi:hypothetical protein